MIIGAIIPLLFIIVSFYIQLDNIKKYIYKNIQSLVVDTHSGDLSYGVKTRTRLENDTFGIIVYGIVDNYHMWNIQEITYISDDFHKLSTDIYFPIQCYYERKIQQIIYEKILYEQSDTAKRKAIDRERQLKKLGI